MATRPGAPNSATSPRTKQPPTPGGVGQQQKPEDNKDSPEYKKKQALAAGPVLAMDYENSTTYGMTPSLFTALKDIFEAVIGHRSRMGVVSPYKFLEVLRRENEMFRTAMHQDAHEFLNLLLNEVLENVEQFSKQEKEAQQAAANVSLSSAVTEVVKATTQQLTADSNENITGWVHELFEGTLTSETRCLTCENTSQRDEAFLDLSVDLEQHSSVTSCLRKFSEEEMLCERNKFHCDNCGGLQEAEKRMKIKRLPRILALHLKRFKYTEDLQRLQKLFHRVVYPYYLRLFNTTDDAEDPDRLYELYAVVVHIGGGPYHGHYVSIIKTQDRGWLLFDDEMVEPVDSSYVRNFFGGENMLACAYILFYQETTLEAMRKEQEAEGLAAEQKATESTHDGLASKANGFAGANGFVHSGLVTPSTPTVEEGDMFVSLDHAATAPVQALPQIPTSSMPVPVAALPPMPLEQVTSSPGLSRHLTLGKSKEDRAAEKERKAAEKKEKAEEKEREKQREKELAKKKVEADDKRREAYKRQEEELKAAIVASKETYKVDKDRTTGDNADPPTIKEGPEKENGITRTGTFNRFRPSSMTLKHKPKLWGSTKDKGETNLKDVSNGVDESAIADGPLSAVLIGQTAEPTPLSAVSTDLKSPKHRFSIGRKKSSLMPRD